MVNNLSYLNLTGIILPILNMKEKAKLFLAKRRLLQMAYSDRRDFFFVGKPTQVLNIVWFSILSVTFVVLFVV